MNEVKGVKFVQMPLHNLFNVIEADQDMIIAVSDYGGYRVFAGDGLYGYSVCMSSRKITFYAGCDDDINPLLINKNSLIVMPLIQQVVHVPDHCVLTGKALALIPYHAGITNNPQIVAYLIAAINDCLKEDASISYAAGDFEDLLITLPVSEETFVLDFDYMQFNEFDK